MHPFMATVQKYKGGWGSVCENKHLKTEVFWEMVWFIFSIVVFLEIVHIDYTGLQNWRSENPFSKFLELLYKFGMLIPKMACFTLLHPVSVVRHSLISEWFKFLHDRAYAMASSWGSYMKHSLLCCISKIRSDRVKLMPFLNWHPKYTNF